MSARLVLGVVGSICGGHSSPAYVPGKTQFVGPSRALSSGTIALHSPLLPSFDIQCLQPSFLLQEGTCLRCVLKLRAGSVDLGCRDLPFSPWSFWRSYLPT